MDYIGIIFYVFLIVLCLSIMYVCFKLLFDFMEVDGFLFKFCIGFILLTVFCIAGLVAFCCVVYKLPYAMGINF